MARSDSTLEIRPVRLGRDYGRTVVVLEGLSDDERLVVNPSDELRNGMRVSFDAPPPAVEFAAK